MRPIHKGAVLAGMTVLAISTSPGDVPRGYESFASRNGRFELRLSSAMGRNPERWLLIERQSGDVSYTLDALLASKWVYVSDDGRNLFAVDYLCPGEPNLDHQVLSFYTDGRLRRAYSLGDLVPSTKYVTRTTSHWVWFVEVHPGSWQRSRRAQHLAPDGTFSLTTLDLREQVFDIATGERVRVRCSPVVPAGSVALSGSVRLVTPAIEGLSPRRFMVKSSCGLCDTPAPEAGVTFEVPEGFVAPELLEFLTDNSLLPNTEYGATVFVRDGQLVGAVAIALRQCN